MQNTHEREEKMAIVPQDPYNEHVNPYQLEELSPGPLGDTEGEAAERGS